MEIFFSHQTLACCFHRLLLSRRYVINKRRVLILIFIFCMWQENSPVCTLRRVRDGVRSKEMCWRGSCTPPPDDLFAADFHRRRHLFSTRSPWIELNVDSCSELYFLVFDQESRWVLLHEKSKRKGKNRINVNTRVIPPSDSKFISLLRNYGTKVDI